MVPFVSFPASADNSGDSFAPTTRPPPRPSLDHILARTVTGEIRHFSRYAVAW